MYNELKNHNTYNWKLVYLTNRVDNFRLYCAFDKTKTFTDTLIPKLSYAAFCVYAIYGVKTKKGEEK